MRQLKTKAKETKIRGAPPKTLAAQENQLAALSVKLAIKQLSDGTASSQVITHGLKLASVREALEKEKLIEENKLLRAKTESLQSGKKIEELYKNAIDAMQIYKGQTVKNDD